MFYAGMTCSSESSNPLEGTVTCSDSKFIGSICNYECYNGFIIIGNESRRCELDENDDAIWSSPQPICESEIIKILFLTFV